MSSWSVSDIQYATVLSSLSNSHIQITMLTNYFGDMSYFSRETEDRYFIVQIKQNELC